MFRIISLVLLLSLWIGCAQKGVVTGGPKDTQPPKVVYASDTSGVVNFNKKSITFEFDEYVQVRSFSKNFVSSPPMNNEVTYKQKGKSIIFEINDTLLGNTTYSLYFGDAVVDVNEGNKWKENTFVFSTGNYIDSLSLSGQVVDAFNSSPKEEVMVLLYRQLEDSAVVNTLPTYLTKTDKNGNFNLKYLASGKYRLIALADKNNNYRLDPKAENMAFYPEILWINEDTIYNSLQLRMFEPSVGDWKVSKSLFNHNQKHTLIFNQPMPEVTLDFPSIDDTTKIYPFYSKNRDTVEHWFDRPLISDLELFLTESKRMDTLSLVPSRAPSLASTKFQFTFKTKKQVHIKASPALNWNAPIVKLDTSQCYLFADSILVPFSISVDEFSKKTALISAKLQPGFYRFVADKGSFQTINQINNDSLSVLFEVKDKDYYGTANIKVNFPKGYNYTVQLIRGKKEIVNETKVIDGVYSWKVAPLLPGNYQLIAFQDNNNNGRWDTGDYFLNLQPEKRFIYKESITIRSNWDADIEWTIAP